MTDPCVHTPTILVSEIPTVVLQVLCVRVLTFLDFQIFSVGVWSTHSALSASTSCWAWQLCTR